MANLIVNVRDLKQKVNHEFNSFKNCQHYPTDETLSKHLDDLLFKVKYEIDQLENGIVSSTIPEEDSKSVLEIRNQDVDMLIKSQTLTTLTKVKEIMAREFHTLTTDSFTSKNLDLFMFNVGYQIEQMKNHISVGKKDEIDEYMGFEDGKVEALIKLQTLASSITCSILRLDNNL